MATAISTTKFDNLPVGQIADLIGHLDAEAKALDARVKEAKAELQARGILKAEGNLFTVTRSDAIRITLDAAAIREVMGPKWCDDHSKLANVTSFRVTVKRAALATIAA